MTIDEHACTGAAHDYDRHDARQHAVRPHSMVNRHHAWPAEQKCAWRKKVRQAYVWPREGQFGESVMSDTFFFLDSQIRVSGGPSQQVLRF